MNHKRKARRAHTEPSKELVPLHDPLWDSQVANILSQVHYYTRTQGSTPTSPEVRRLIGIDATGRLEKLVTEMEARIGYTPKTAEAQVETSVLSASPL